MQFTYYRVTHGTPHDICAAHQAACAASDADLLARIVRYGAISGHSLRYGNNHVMGLRFKLPPPRGSGWKARKAHPSYYVPNESTVVGKLIRRDLDTGKPPTGTELALALGCKTFFTDLDSGGLYCAALGFFVHGESFYLDGSCWGKPDMTPTGIQIIPASAWHKAGEDRRRAAKVEES